MTGELADVPTTMRAVVLVDRGGERALEVVERPVPRPGPGEVLLRITSFGVNNADLLACRGAIPVPEGGVPGLEAVGRVVTHGQVTGERVGALLRSGGYAEYVVAPAWSVFPIPDAVDDGTAAAVPEALATAWWNLVDRGRLRRGASVLVHGGAGGVGTVAVQLAAALGARVVTTVRGEGNAAALRKLGARATVDHTDDDAIEQLEAVEPSGFDLILDNQGGPTLMGNVRLLAPGARLVIVGTQGGGPGVLDTGVLMAKGLTVSSSSLGRLSDEQRSALCDRVRDHAAPLVADGRIRPVVSEEFMWPEVGAAHRAFARAGKLGKIVVRMNSAI